MVVGTSCAGKTTLARGLSRALGVPHVELDALYWGPRWTPAPDGVFRARVAEASAAAAWVIDGNYSSVRELVWPRATALIWLDLPFRVVFTRAVLRTLGRFATREPLWAGNRETLAIADPDWIPWWVLRTFRHRRRDMAHSLREPRHAHLWVEVLRSGRAAQRFVRALSS